MGIVSHLEDKHLTLHLIQTFNIIPRPVRDRQFILPRSTWDKIFPDNFNLFSLTRNLTIRWQMSVINLHISVYAIIF